MSRLFLALSLLIGSFPLSALHPKPAQADSPVISDADSPDLIVGSYTIPPVNPDPVTGKLPADQPPVLYVHGWNDDGVGWIGGCDQTEPNGATFFRDAGIESWIVQWWGGDQQSFVNPYTTAEQGWAFLTSPDRLGDTDRPSVQNRPCNGAPIVNNYNDSGAVAEHAQNLLDRLRSEMVAGKLKDYRQINIITHSKGSLVVRAMLDLAAESSRYEAEMVANVVYNAPPFAGSSLAPIIADLFVGAQPSDVFTNPWFLASYGETMVGETAGVIIETMIDDILRFGTDNQVTFADLKERLSPAVFIPLEVLKSDNWTVTSVQFWTDFSNTLSASNDLSLSTLSQLFKLIRSPFITQKWSPIAGFPSAPALYDLDPDSGHVTQYSNTNFTKQFVTYGENSLVGRVGLTIFPCAPTGSIAAGDLSLPCLNNIVTDPSVIGDAMGQIYTIGDGAVAQGSAMLLTQTDAFGPRFTPLASAPIWHGATIGKPKYFGDDWLEVFLMPLTSLKLEGTIEEADSQNRSFIVSQETTFSFDSAPTKRGGVEVKAARHQYRVIRYTGSGSTPSDWVDVDLDSTIRFARLQFDYDLENIPFWLEWRAINKRGGQEIIRSARFVIEPPAPQIVNEFILFNTAEVHRRGVAVQLDPVSVRADVFDSGADPVLGIVQRAPEAQWVVRDQTTKFYTGIFSNDGHVEYVWDEPAFTNTTIERDANALYLPMAGLDEGLHTLYFETFNSLDQRSARQKISVLIDNTPPIVTFQGSANHAIGTVVGPNTPLNFEVYDVASNGGSGTVSVPGHPGGPLPLGDIFTLGETNLAEQGQQSGGVGIFVPLTATGIDWVNNSATETVEVYYDWTAPTITLLDAPDALPTEFGYRTFTNTVQIIVDVDEAGSGLQPILARVQTADDDELISAAFTQNGSGNYTGDLYLAPGLNSISIIAQDSVGNVNSLDFQIEYSQVEFDQAPLQTLTPRLDITCYNDSGDEVSCTPGQLNGWDSSYYGDIFVFSSSGRSLAPGDTNNEEDVFVWRNGTVLLASATISGTQANDRSNRPTVSGDGRYVYFRSTATNLAPGTEANRYNLYVKDIETDEIAVISRDSNGAPANLSGSTPFYKPDATYDGRYVFFESNYNQHVSGLTDTNIKRDIFMVDLDPDGNGYYFDDNYITSAISTIPGGTQTGNGESRSPDVSQDGRYIAFVTAATDIESTLASNGATNDVLLVELGVNPDGSLNPDIRTLIPINTDASNSSQMTSSGADSPRVGPNDDTVVFTTRSNITGTGDANHEVQGQDVYISRRTGSVTDRDITWVSRANGVGGPQSSENINASFASLSIAVDTPISTETFGAKVGWVSIHDNMEANDSNGVADMFIRRDSLAYPEDMPVINWIASDQPSDRAVTDGGLSPDGRYAYWVTTQTFTPPYSSGPSSIYRRRITPIQDYPLAVTVVGEGAVQDATTNAVIDGGALYSDTVTADIIAVPAIGWRLVGWDGADTTDSESAQVKMHHPRAITVTFEQMNAPLAATLSLSTSEDMESAGGFPLVTDPDPNDSHLFSIVTQPEDGAAYVRNNRIHYQPDLNFNGADQFTIQATDLYGLTLPEPAIVSVTVAPVNDPPTSATATGAAAADPTGILLTPDVADVDDDAFALAVSVQPAHGTVTVVHSSARSTQTGQQFKYIPDDGFSGEDTFTFQVSDEAGLSVLGLASIMVTSDPDPQSSQKVYLPVVTR